MDEQKRYDIAALVTRLGVGILLFWMGMLKLFSPAMQRDLATVAEMTPLVPAGYGGIFITVVYWFEIVGGFLLIIGLFTRAVGWLTALLMLGSLLVLNWYLPPQMMGPWGPFILKDIAILGASISLGLTGSHLWSADTFLE